MKKNKTFTSSDTKQVSADFDDFMLERPEPIKKEKIKFTTHRLGIKDTLKRTEIYEDK